MNKYSFLDILSKEIIIDENNNSILLDKIEIPMIQRDYAQGRDDELVVRNRFLDSIFNTLTSNEILDLDFIYGSILEFEENKTITFSLLDGQQRLTTLFLLYWYIGSVELSSDEYDILKKDMLKFTYATRTSSRDFCRKLVETSFENNIKPKEYITNLPWFFKVYEKDPTIKAMLNMLNSIHKQYTLLDNTKKIFNNLKNLQFHVLPLNGFNLSEELYIKMNSRGKQLTDFENFKADLINWMKEEKNKYYDIYQRKVELKSRKLPHYLVVSQKIDDDWTNFLWERTKLLKEKIIDPLFIQLFYRYFLNQYILLSASDETKIGKEEIYIALMKENRGSKYQEFTIFEKVLVQKDIISTFEIFFDATVENWETIKSNIQPSWKEKDWSFLDENITLPDRVVFMAISLYLEKNENFEETTFSQWMRVVWNLVENTDIDSAVSMIGIMKLIDELSVNSNDIYNFLANEANIVVSNSSKVALEEERKKSRYIVSEDILWEKSFVNAEKHPFFKGSIGFIMMEDMDISKFEHSTKMSFKVFDKKGVNEKYRDDGHIFLRALISQYTDHSLIGQSFVDVDEKEHYLKKILSNNETVRQWTKQLFNLENEQKILDSLEESVKNDSVILGWSKNNVIEKNRIRKAHKALYQEPILQNWLQETETIYLGWRRDHLYIWKKRSWYNWVMLDSNRNNLITYILSKGFVTERQIKYQDNELPYYWGNDDIDVYGKIGDYEIKFTFDGDKDLLISFKATDLKWIEVYSYDYMQEDEELITLLNNDIFNESNLKSLIDGLI